MKFPGLLIGKENRGIPWLGSHASSPWLPPGSRSPRRAFLPSISVAKALAAYRQGLSEDEMKALGVYKGAGFEGVNARLRGCADPAALGKVARGHFDGLAGILKKAGHLPHPAVAYRGVRLGVEDAPGFVARCDKAAADGEIVEFRGVNSFSLNPAVAAHHAVRKRDGAGLEGPPVVFEALLKTCAFLGGRFEMEEGDRREAEFEVIVSHGTRFRVLEVLQRVRFDRLLTKGEVAVTLVRLEEVDAPAA